MNAIVATAVSFITSALLYHPTHRRDFPELGRYVLGGLLVVAAHRLLFPAEREGVHRLGAALAATGLGVGLARIWPLLTEEA